MENASKALIIAGAILISILLISLGVVVFTKAQDTASNPGISEVDVSAFNNNLIKYEGTDVKGALVKNLISEINALNANSANQSANIKVELTSTGDPDLGGVDISSATNGAQTYKSNGVINSRSYTVVIETYETDGRVNQISINAN